MTSNKRLNAFGEFLANHADRILEEWEKEATRSGALHVSRQRFANGIPSLLDGLAHASQKLAAGEEPEPSRWPAAMPYADDAGNTYRLENVVADLTLLRDCILRSWESSARYSDGADVGRIVNRAIDRAIIGAAQDLGRRASAAIQNAHLHEQSQNSIRLRERILAIVSHDLRNPLAAIDISSMLLLKSPAVSGNRALRRQVDVIHRNVVRATRLINDLLDMSSIQAGQLSMEWARVELRSLLLGAIGDHEPVATEHGMALRSELRVENGYARCDQGRIAQVIANLIGNSIKFCEAGDEIMVRAEAKDGHALISISDTGPGIAAEDLRHLFDLHWNRRRARGGSGLGLYIAKGIVESHGGRLWVESRLGEGSTFWFTLPLLDGS